MGMLKIKMMRSIFQNYDKPTNVIDNFNLSLDYVKYPVNMFLVSRQNFHDKFAFKTRYYGWLASCVFLPFYVKKRSLRAFIYTFVVGSWIICPEFTHAMAFGHTD